MSIKKFFFSIILLAATQLAITAGKGGQPAVGTIAQPASGFDVRLDGENPGRSSVVDAGAQTPCCAVASASASASASAHASTSTSTSTSASASVPAPAPTSASHTSVPVWYELPSCSDSSDFCYSFTKRSDAPGIRNFSCCYSKGRFHPVWVAAPMHKSYLGESGRTGSYKQDPQMDCPQNIRWEGYTRGHLLGSRVRTVTRETNRQVFYYSNIGAQTQAGFNAAGGAWNNLEEFVDRQWESCSDTLYQVIGCIFDEWTDRYGRSVAPVEVSGSLVPSAYYKVVLRTKDGNSGKDVGQCTADELKCAAFILSHRANGGHRICSDDMYTVEYVEKLTGLEFFVNVPSAPKDKVYASDWGL